MPEFDYNFKIREIPFMGKLYSGIFRRVVERIKWTAGGKMNLGDWEYEIGIYSGLKGHDEYTPLRMTFRKDNWRNGRALVIEMICYKDVEVFSITSKGDHPFSGEFHSYNKFNNEVHEIFRELVKKYPKLYEGR